MKQLLFLILFPAYAMAQYPGNANQKITLGEQTTADGLVYRGRLADTANLLTNKLDTSVYIVLDTGTRAMWYYRASSTPKWTRLVDSLNNMQGLLTLSTKVTGTLPVANGGTGASTLAANKVMVGNGTSGVLTPTNLHWDNTNSMLGIKQENPLFNLDINGTFRMSHSTANAYSAIFYNSNLNGEGVTIRGGSASNHNSLLVQTYNGGSTLFAVLGNGNVGIGVESPTEKLHVAGNARIGAVGAGTFANNLNITSDGTLTTATSDEKYKYNILPINYGLNTILQLKPVNFQWINGEEQDLGFIAQDVAEIIPEAVSTNWNSDLLFRYECLIPILTKAIQEQQALIKALEQRIINLENK